MTLADCGGTGQLLRIETSRPVNPRHSYAYLDGVRGWAALMVAYSHFVAAMHPAMLGAGDERAHFAGAAWFGRTGLIVLYNPQLAVDIFFVLSGFVLATSVNNRPASFIELAVRRWLRLGLPILGTTALIWPLVNFHLFSPDTAGPLAKSGWLTLCYNWTAWPVYPAMTLSRLFLQSLVSVFTIGVHWYNPALWTMKMEFYGSIGLFAGYCLLPAAWARRGAGLAAALVAIGFTWQIPLLGPFCFGIALFEIRRLCRARFTIPSYIACASAVMLLVMGVLLGGVPYDARAEPYHSLYLIGEPWVGAVPLVSFRLAALCIVAAVLIWAPLQQPLRGRVSQWLGQASFALYLVHVPILCSLGAWLLLWLEPVLGYNLATLVTLPLFLAAALTLAGLVARWIDQPAIQLSKKIGAAVLPALQHLRPAVARADFKPVSGP
jgi:peptidoglycan/LPS O-acetylase OafA/YrhL